MDKIYVWNMTKGTEDYVTLSEADKFLSNENMECLATFEESEKLLCDTYIWRNKVTKEIYLIS